MPMKDAELPCRTAQRRESDAFLAVLASDPDGSSGPRGGEELSQFVQHAKRAVTLREIKASHAFDNWALVRQGRAEHDAGAAVLDVVAETGGILSDISTSACRFWLGRSTTS